MSVVGRLADRSPCCRPAGCWSRGRTTQVRADERVITAYLGSGRCCAIEGLSAWYGEAQVLREVEPGRRRRRGGHPGRPQRRRQVDAAALRDGPAPGPAGHDRAGRPGPRAAARRTGGPGSAWAGCPTTGAATPPSSSPSTWHLPPVVGPGRRRLVARPRVYETFPALYARRAAPATTLSGGEQQMLALARVLRMGARLLLCDEPTEGLSPLLVAQVGEILRQAKQHGVTVLLVEQNLRFATDRRRPALPARRGPDRRGAGQRRGRGRGSASCSRTSASESDRNDDREPRPARNWRNGHARNRWCGGGLGRRAARRRMRWWRTAAARATRS